MLTLYLTIDELRIDLPRTEQDPQGLPYTQLFKAINVMGFAFDRGFSDGVADGVYFVMDGHHFEQPDTAIQAN